MSKPFVCENYETSEVDKAGDNEVEASFQLNKKCEWNAVGLVLHSVFFYFLFIYTIYMTVTEGSIL